MKDVKDFIAREKLVPVVKLDDAADTLPLMEALKAGGINVAEITLRTACGAEAISIAASNCKDMLIGAGTVINAQQAEKAVAAGAKFIVGPGYSQGVAEVCKKSGVMYLPGCVTPTEIMVAIDNGIDIIKFFPAESYGGLSAIRAIAAAFPELRFVPTGGISAANIKEYLSYNKVFACGGSWMVKDNLIKSHDFATVTKLSREAKELIGL